MNFRLLIIALLLSINVATTYSSIDSESVVPTRGKIYHPGSDEHFQNAVNTYDLVVVDFYADWCQPCKQLDSALAKVKSNYGERVTFMRVDVDDPNSQPLMDQYEVSPIPTMVFLNPEGEVSSYSIGFTSESNISSSINKILK